MDGKPIAQLKQYSAFMPQKDLLFPWRTIEQNICLPMELAGVEKKEQEKRCKEVLEQVGLLDYMKKYPKDLSGGMKQRVSFARTLLSGADMLLLGLVSDVLDMDAGAGVNKAVLSFTVSEFDSVDEISIPDEAKAALESK